jgi:hypothetical protein
MVQIQTLLVGKTVSYYIYEGSASLGRRDGLLVRRVDAAFRKIALPLPGNGKINSLLIDKHYILLMCLVEKICSVRIIRSFTFSME